MKTVKDLRQNLEFTRRKIEVKSREEAKAVEEETLLKKDKIQTIDNIKREEEDLVTKTMAAQDKMDDMLKRQSSVGRNLAGREAELEAAIMNKALAEQNLSDFEKQVTEFLKKKGQRNKSKEGLPSSREGQSNESVQGGKAKGSRAA